MTRLSNITVVGTGLIGTSLGLALSRRGFRVSLSDPSPTAARLARDLGAGELAVDQAPDPHPDQVASLSLHWPREPDWHILCVSNFMVLCQPA